jgi:tRNA G18 (ribose-2'-O)-methylase SpoU
LQIASTDLHATRSFTEIDFSLPTAIVMGSESEGLSAEEIALSDIAVKIPMKGSTESLNVAVAAGILLYEAARQR